MTNRQTDKQTNRQTDKQTNRQTDKQTNRQTDKQVKLFVSENKIFNKNVLIDVGYWEITHNIYLAVILTSFKNYSRSSKVKSLKRETEPIYYINSSLMFIFYALYDFFEIKHSVSQ